MKSTILVVDDSEFDRTLLAQSIKKKLDVDVIEVGNGDHCLEILKTNTISLILMDIMMPGMFGTNVLIKIRESFNAVDLPVIMATSKADTADVIECLRTGANDYITKPFNFDIAASRISTHLRLAELSREMATLKEASAIAAMITTYNHEINNPLSIAISCIGKSDWKKDSNKEKIENALWRIADIVKKIKELAKNEIEYESYSSSSKMIKLK